MAAIEGRGGASVEGEAHLSRRLQVLNPADIDRAGDIIEAVWADMAKELDFVEAAPGFSELLAFDEMDLPPDEGEATALVLAHRICAEHDDWKANKATGIEHPHPLEPELLAWHNKPVVVQAATRKDRRIMPTVSARESRPERLRGMLFGGLGDAPAEAELPLFAAPPVRHSVPILDLADASGVPVMAQGRGAPLPQRLFVRLGLSFDSPEDMRQPSVRMAIKVRELRDGLHPPSLTTGKTGWRAGKDWQNLKDALIAARNYTIRLPSGRLWFMVALRELPSEDRAGKPGLEDHVVLDIALPPGASDGPMIHLPTLDRLGVDSAPKYRAYVAGHSLTWAKGKTRVKIPRRNRWAWSRNLEAYPVLTIKDRS